VALAVAPAVAFPVGVAHAADLQTQVVAGDWTSVALQEEIVVKSARYAIAEQSRRMRTEIRLLSIKHARQQVVAGTNYSMNLMVQGEGKHHLVIAAVWVKPDGSMELTRWHWV
jgi:hypothetical protein